MIFWTKEFRLQLLVSLSALFLVCGACSLTFAQKRKLQDTTAKVVAAFNSQCATTNFPRKQLKNAIKRATLQIKDEISHPEDGKVAVAYDLNGDGRNEYFVWLKDTGIGDNVYWGVFASNPTRFLGVIFAEHIYIRRRVNGWSALTISSHLSSSDSLITTYAYRNGKYVKAVGGYEVSANRNDEPKFVGKVPYLCERY